MLTISPRVPAQILASPTPPTEAHDPIARLIEHLTRLNANDDPDVTVDEETFDHAKGTARYSVSVSTEVLSAASQETLLNDASIGARTRVIEPTSFYGDLPRETISVSVTIPIATLENIPRGDFTNHLGRLLFGPIAEALARASLDVETAFITASPAAATTATNDPEDIEVIATNDLDATNEDPPSAAISPSASPSDEDVDRLVAQLTAINAQNDGRVALVIEHDEAHLTATVSIRTEILPALIVEAARESEPSALKDGLLIRRVKINGAWARALEEWPTQNIHRAAFSCVATWLVVLGGCGPQSIL